MSVWTKVAITVCVAAALFLCPTGLFATSAQAAESAHPCCPAKPASVPDCHLCWFMDTSHSPDAISQAAPPQALTVAVAQLPAPPVSWREPRSSFAADPPRPPLPPYRPLRI